MECVDDKMLIFDPADKNPLNKLSDHLLNSLYAQRRRRTYRKAVVSSNSGNSSNCPSSPTTRRTVSGSRIRSRRRQYTGDDKISASSKDGEIRFVFDKLFDEDASQDQIYKETTKQLIDSVLDGFNGTVFAYGATGCGKTYTVSGTQDYPGIIFRAMDDLFKRIEELQDDKNFEVSLSYLEIYNETIRDLLNPDMSSKKLVIREDSNQRTTVANLSYHYPKTVQDVIDLVIRGNLNRTTSPTEANEVSSRSHAVLQVHVLQTNKQVDLVSKHTFATLSIIDLAGSERAASTKNRGQRLLEGANINRSLLALGNCINALCVNSDNARRTCHIPYRDSKLTRLLKFSLGGNCKTVMIVCIAPGSHHYDETLNTLKYANRAKEIKTKLIRNQQSLSRHVGSYLKMITEQKRQIEELQSREAKMIKMALTRYKLGEAKVETEINDVVNRVHENMISGQKYRHAKKLKSLILVKRRFLQLVRLEVGNILGYIEFSMNQDDLYNVSRDCQLLLQQLDEKVYELETNFDSSDTVTDLLEDSKRVDLIKLRELDNWDDSRHLQIFLNKLDYISELVRNEIMVNASTIMERLFECQPLTRRFNILSECLCNHRHQQETGNTTSDIVADLHKSLKGLVDLDKEFDEFARVFIDNDDTISNIAAVSNVTSSSRDSIGSNWTTTGATGSAAAVALTNVKKSSLRTEGSNRNSVSGNVVKKLRWSDSIPNSPVSSPSKDSSSGGSANNNNNVDNDDNASNMLTSEDPERQTSRPLDTLQLRETDAAPRFSSSTSAAASVSAADGMDIDTSLQDTTMLTNDGSTLESRADRMVYMRDASPDGPSVLKPTSILLQQNFLSSLE